MVGAVGAEKNLVWRKFMWDDLYGPLKPDDLSETAREEL